MTPQSLIEKLEALGTIDPVVLGKLRRRVENPEKSSSVNQILSFLVKNQYLTRDQALQLKRELEADGQGPESQEPETPDVRDEVDDLLAGVLDTEDETPEIIEEPAGEEEEPPEAEPVPKPGETMEPSSADDTAISELAAEESVHDVFEADEADEPEVYDDEHDFAGTAAASPDDYSSFSQPAAGHRSGFKGKIDSRDQWATKWLFIGFGTLGVLLVAGTLLIFVLSLISAEDRFDAAMSSFEAGTYGDAIKKFDEYLDKHPSHKNAAKARVTRVHALLAETYKQKNWDETIVRAQTYLPRLVEDDSVDLEPLREDLKIMLPNSALAMARRATLQETKSGLIEQLEQAKQAKGLVDNRVYIPNSKRKQALVAKILDDIDEEIAKGDGLIRKQADFEQTLTRIESFRDQGETDNAFAEYNQLIRTYGDLRANEQLQTEMRLVSEQEVKLVKPVEAGVTTSSTLRSSPIQSTIVLASTTGTPISTLTGEVVPVLADGAVYGIDIGDGSVKWRLFTGYQTNIQPMTVNADHVLVSDPTHHDLMLLNSRDGTPVWRDEIGEPFLEPQVVDQSIYLTTESGKLLRMDLKSGEVLACVRIPQRANVPMVVSPRTGLVIQPGFYSNIYLLSAEDLGCRDVFYLGHNRGSISVPPVVWNNMILVPVNQSGVCDLNILRPGEEGIDLQLVQRIRRVTRGIVTNPLARFGRFMLITSESGDLKILELNTAEETNPVRILAEEKFENREGARAYVTTAGSQLWIGVKGIMRYKVSRALGTFTREQISNSDDFFVGPILKFGDQIIHVRKRFGSAMTSVSAVDAETLEPDWRTDLGGPLAGAPVLSGNQLAAVSSQGDLFSVDAGYAGDQVATGGLKASNIVDDLLFDQMLDLSDGSRVAIGPPDQPNILFVDIQRNTSKLFRLPKPADQAASRPIIIGDHLIAPSRQGQVVRVDPRSGQIVGTPFLPPVRPGTPVNWKKPAAIGEGRFVIGADSNLYLIDAADPKVLRKTAETKIEGMLKSALAPIDDGVLAIVSNKTSDKLVSVQANGNGLAVVESIDLPALSMAGPWTSGDLVFIRLDNGQLACLDANLSSRWSTEISDGTLAAAPQVTGSGVQLFFEDGRVVTLDPATGVVRTQQQLGQPIVHLPVTAGSTTFFAGRDGTIHRVELSAD